MRSVAIVLILGIWTLLTTGCAGKMKVCDFKDEKPELIPEDFFLGDLTGHGVFYDRFGKVRKRWVMDLKGTLDERGQLVLKEDLQYSDGGGSERNYRFSKVGEKQYEARADGLVGAAKIEACGNALHWPYKLRQEIKGDEWVLSFDDWMFRLSDTILLNRARAYKWGLFVGEVFMTVEKNVEKHGEG